MKQKLVVAVVLVALNATAFAAEFTLERGKDNIQVNLNGKLFTNYLIQSGNKPILWPIIGPNGEEMTRGYPMKDALSSERSDHHHHRSFWFTHGDVDGISFWHQAEGTTGYIVHKGFVEVKSSTDNPVIKTHNDWLGPKKNKICEDVRLLTFGADEKARWIDFEVTVKATEKDVKFGDTKEGSFGVRTAGTMKVDSKLGGKIINSEGQTDKGAWGKPAAWVDYHGPVNSKSVGITIMNHPSSFCFAPKQLNNRPREEMKKLRVSEKALKKLNEDPKACAFFDGKRLHISHRRKESDTTVDR